MSNNDTLAEAICKIEDLVLRGAAPTVKEIGGRTYLLQNNLHGEPSVTEVIPKDNTAFPRKMEVNTLDAFVAYLRAGIENGEIKDKLYLNVTSPIFVEAVTPVNQYGNRKLIASAARLGLQGFSFGLEYDFERFVVALRSKFVPTPEQTALLESLKRITNSNEVKTEDNGVTQVVTAKSGATLGSVKVQPVWCLRPYRTFTEIDQPDSLFLLRLHSNGGETTYSLYETDGGAWAVTAMNLVREYLRSQFSDAVYADKIYVL